MSYRCHPILIFVSFKAQNVFFSSKFVLKKIMQTFHLLTGIHLMMQQENVIKIFRDFLKAMRQDGGSFRLIINMKEMPVKGSMGRRPPMNIQENLHEPQ